MTSNQTVRRYEEKDLDVVVEFIKEVAMAENVDEEIVKNSILVATDSSINGMVSFEMHEHMGVIRYFICDQYTMPDLLVNMFFELYAKAKERGINQLIAIASNPYAYQLFEMLGFIEIKKSVDFKISNLVDDENVSVMSIKL